MSPFRILSDVSVVRPRKAVPLPARLTPAEEWAAFAAAYARDAAARRRSARVSK